LFGFKRLFVRRAGQHFRHFKQSKAVIIEAPLGFGVFSVTFQGLALKARPLRGGLFGCVRRSPKWQYPNQKLQISTNDLIKQLRFDLWKDSISSTYLSDFVSQQNSNQSLFNIEIPAFYAVLKVNLG
jgi:hypothetical protein